MENIWYSTIQRSFEVGYSPWSYSNQKYDDRNRIFDFIVFGYNKDKSLVCKNHMPSTQAWNKSHHWKICPKCDGTGKRRQKPWKKAQQWYQKELTKYGESWKVWPVPVWPAGHIHTCDNCHGSGLIPTDIPPAIDANYPHVAIIGGWIGWVALAIACFHRSIPFTLYERDVSFDARSQWYGLTLQQANKAMESFGITELRDEIRTTRHLVHTPDGKIIGEWGKKKEGQMDNKTQKQKNGHISRQSLRMQLLEKLAGCDSVKWWHKLIDFSHNGAGHVELTFEVNKEKKKAQADMIVGADGIRSVVRKWLIREDKNPLQYTGYIVILGICSLKDITDTQSSLLDWETVFQTVNGHERIYIMPFSRDEVMWQMSFPMWEDEARALSAKGPESLKQEAILRAPWHDPIPQILAHTSIWKITGYPIYDREILTAEHFKNAGNATLIGDAAHPMSPFKGQGANRALLDALLLSRMIYAACKPGSDWQKKWLRKTVLEKFESEMIEQSTSKVQGSREAARLLHSEAVLHDGDTTKRARDKI
jgi:2-polyprenyl-6-methoxyphenol hydroxylase-like FAD-dependent oxidoreductase